VRYVRINRFAELTGYTEKAVYEKIRVGVWIEGVHYRKAPDGHILIDLEAIERWVEGQQAA
jgi:hypothetical protein